MTAARRLPVARLSTGLLVVIGALDWWWASYGEVYAYDYLTLGQAGLCLVGESETCRLATSLCRGRHQALAAPYSSSALWVGLSFLCSSIVLTGRTTTPAKAVRGTSGQGSGSRRTG